MQPYFWPLLEQGLFLEACVIVKPGEATMLVNKQQCNKLYITYVLQDAVYFLELFLEWVCLHNWQALFLGGVLLQWELYVISYCIKKEKRKTFTWVSLEDFMLTVIHADKMSLVGKQSQWRGWKVFSITSVCVCAPFKEWVEAVSSHPEPLNLAPS